MSRRAAVAAGFAWSLVLLGGCSEVRKYQHRRVRGRIDRHVELAET